MTKVGSSTFSIEQYPTTDYSTTYISLNADSIATLLGCSTSDMVLQAIDNNGALSTNSTATKGGYWMTQGGIICGWGDNAYFFVEPNVQGDYSQLNFGQMPGNTAIGEEGHTMLYLTANGNYYELDITLKIVAKEIVGLESFENVATRNLTIQQEYITYEWSKAASIPMEQIYSLIGTTEPVLYGLAVDSVAATTGSKYTDDYTCSPFPGFWLNAEGRNDKWGSSTFTWGMSAAVEVSDEAYNINCMLDHGAIGDVYNGQFFLANLENQKMITINLTYQIVETLVEFEVVGEEWINLPVGINAAYVQNTLQRVPTQ